jgi:hypothetical protein
MKGEKNMKIKQKLAIFAAAVVLSFFGFSLVASPSVELIKMGKDAGTQSLASYLATADVTVHANLKG